MCMTPDQQLCGGLPLGSDCQPYADTVLGIHKYTDHQRPQEKTQTDEKPPEKRSIPLVVRLRELLRKEALHVNGPMDIRTRKPLDVRTSKQVQRRLTLVLVAAQQSVLEVSTVR